MKSNAVVCVWHGDKYGPEYLIALRRMVWEYAPHAEFHCLTDRDVSDLARISCRSTPEGVPELPETYFRPLRFAGELKGWWAKMELFHPGNADLLPALFLDLDTFVTGNIDDLLSIEDGELWMVDDFCKPGNGQSCVMHIPTGLEEIWHTFAEASKSYMSALEKQGDQGFINRYPHRTFQSEFEGITSYKMTPGMQKAPKGRIINFHGRPKPHEMASGWVADMWRKYAPRA